jgi:hypothetical protein
MRYRVRLLRTVVEAAEIEVEAENEAQAGEVADEIASEGSVHWDDYNVPARRTVDEVEELPDAEDA